MVYGMELIHDEIVDTFDVKYNAGSYTGYTLSPGINEKSDRNLKLKSLLPDDVKLNNTIDGIRLRANVTTDKTIEFIKKSFFYSLLVFTQLHSGALGDIKGLIQLISGLYKNEKLIYITGVDETHLKRDCINGSNVNSSRETFLYGFALDKAAVIIFIKRLESDFLKR